MHFPNTGSLITGIPNLAGKHMVIFPFAFVLVADPSCMFRRFAREQPGPCRDAAGTGSICLVKSDAIAG